MKHMIALACVLGAAMGQYWGGHGGVHDTPEVEAAKAAHFAAHAKARAQLSGHGHAWKASDRSWAPEPQHQVAEHWEEPQHQVAQHWEEPHHKWTGPIALPPGYDKHGAPLPVLDTPEVEAEKHRHFALYSHGAYAGAYAAHGAGGHGEWSAPDHHSSWTPTSGPWGY